MSYTIISLGQKIEALRLKLDDMQREIVGLRQDVRAILYLLKETQQSPQDVVNAADQTDCDSGEI